MGEYEFGYHPGYVEVLISKARNNETMQPLHLRQLQEVLCALPNDDDRRQELLPLIEERLGAIDARTAEDTVAQIIVDAEEGGEVERTIWLEQRGGEAHEREKVIEGSDAFSAYYTTLLTLLAQKPSTLGEGHLLQIAAYLDSQPTDQLEAERVLVAVEMDQRGIEYTPSSQGKLTASKAEVEHRDRTEHERELERLIVLIRDIAGQSLDPHESDDYEGGEVILSEKDKKEIMQYWTEIVDVVGIHRAVDFQMAMELQHYMRPGELRYSSAQLLRVEPRPAAQDYVNKVIRFMSEHGGSLEAMDNYELRLLYAELRAEHARISLLEAQTVRNSREQRHITHQLNDLGGINQKLLLEIHRRSVRNGRSTA